MSVKTEIKTSSIKRIVLLVSSSEKDGDSFFSAIEESITHKCLSRISDDIVGEEVCYCRLICTEQSRKTADFLRRKFKSKFEFGDLVLLKGIDSALEIFETIIKIAEEPGNSGETIFCDCTGGTKTMSIAVALACTHFNLTRTSKTNLTLTYIAGRPTEEIVFRKYDLSDVVAEEQQRYVDQQERVGRLSYMARLTPILAHEIKNPLNTIAMSLYLLKDMLGERELRELQLMERAVNEIRETIDTIQQKVRKGADDFIKEKIQLAEVIRRLSARTERNFPGLILKIDDDIPDLQLEIAEEKLYTIFSNLMDNAAQASQGKGLVRLTFRRVPDFLRVTIEDSGPGIPQKMRKTLFKPLFRGENSLGTGMGLSIVKVFLAEEGGTIVYDDGYAGGARFIVELPVES